MLDIYSKILNSIEKIVRTIVAVLIVVLFAIAIAEVFHRYVLAKTWKWSDEVLRYLLAWIAFLGVGLSYRNNRLAKFDLLDTKLSARGLSILKLVTNTIVTGFSLFVAIRGYSYATSNTLQRQLSMGTKIPMMYFYLCIPIGMALMLLFSIEKYGVIISGLRNGSKNESEGA